uniref:Integrase, catalytic region, zinc finger, CCHC-type, peptidase aspartic, catalytic n=1 Tax=Tanacetum cinerariifolium TaxID=118510 RepID=A0A699HPZ6_TANCI|nr:integrase, catalytic region, zinc finger, CCHC-type, peptidase aspartic, catalytic [Tanacetum cinerariifolium]
MALQPHSSEVKIQDLPCSIIKDKDMMKAQVHVSKSSAIFDEQVFPQRKHHCQIYHVVNNQAAKIMGYGDYQIRNIKISRVYYVKGLGHNLFSTSQFRDSDLEVAFWKHTFFVCNLEGVDLLIGSKDTNLYTLSLDDMLKSSSICLLSKASKTKSCLWQEVPAADAPRHVDPTGTPLSTSIDQDAPSASTLPT